MLVFFSLGIRLETSHYLSYQTRMSVKDEFNYEFIKFAYENRSLGEKPEIIDPPELILENLKKIYEIVCAWNGEWSKQDEHEISSNRYFMTLLMYNLIEKSTTNRFFISDQNKAQLKEIIENLEVNIISDDL